MKPLRLISLILVLSASVLGIASFAEDKGELPPWQKKFLGPIEKSMSNVEHHKIGEEFNVVSYKRKGLELKPGGVAETDHSYEEINIYKNDKLLVTIADGDDGGHGLLLYSNLKNGKRVIAVEISDRDGDGIYEDLYYDNIDQNGGKIKTIYDQKLDGNIRAVEYSRR